jgi:electron transport complex protein RnfG
MKEIIRITIGLTISCLIAAIVMGTVFAITDRAKKNNERVNLQETMLSLLGYSKSNPPPSNLKLHTIYRYVINDRAKKEIGYMVPVEKGGKEGYDLLIVNLKGEFEASYSLSIWFEKASEPSERQSALDAVLKPPKTFTYADSTIVADLGDKRTAYLLPGEFPGFKTFIHVMLALDPSLKIIGLDITEQEEDPGLGGEIAQPYFKNQFRGKTFEKVKELKVIKEPLPTEYKKYLEGSGQFKAAEIDAIRSKYQYKDIYALTGATISSRSVTEGVKNMVENFAYRLKILDRVIAKQDVPVAF